MQIQRQLWGLKLRQNLMSPNITRDADYLKGGYKHTDSWGCGKMVWPQIHLEKKEKLATGLWGKLLQILFGKINGSVGPVLNKKRISFK